MNYDYADKHKGLFNTPGILLTDAVMMALGGDHLELGGDHMLSREYFPTGPLKMTDELKTAMIRYYDFMTAYENLLRGTSLESEKYVSVNCPDQYRGFHINYWPPKQRTITTFAKEVEGKTVVHMLNFINAENLCWRDLNLTRPNPQVEENIPLIIDVDRAVDKVWLASPDYNGGVAQMLPFEYCNGQVSVTIPAIKYWDMIVIE
jgi:dextranase